MYRIVPVHYSSWVLVFPFVAIGIALAASTFMVWVFSAPKGQNEWLFNYAVACFFLAAISLLAGFVGLGMCYEAYRYGRDVIFDDQLTMHYPWPYQSRVFAWDEIIGLEVIDEQVAVDEPVGWVPIPLGAFVPGADAMLSVGLSEQRLVNVRKYRIRHKDGRVLANFPGTTELSFKLDRWFGRYHLHRLVKASGGQITWKGDAPSEISLRGCQFAEGQFDLLKESMANVTGLEELDLSGTNLNDPALAGLDSAEYLSLKAIRAQGSRISATALTRLNATLSQRGTKSIFNFA